MSNIQKFTLSNGVRILVEPVTHVQSAAIGLWCKTGSRHENENEAGITHLIEHMLFKGTDKRTSKQIAESIEGRGGVLNAFTDKEATCYYCRVLADDALNGVEVLTDMMLHSKFEPSELEVEKGVVCEEIKRSNDEPSDQVHELHLSYRWGNHPLGKPIIGTKESVQSFFRQNIVDYMERRYLGENVLLSVAGNVDPAQVLASAQELLGRLGTG
ncbi:MAG TPA: pitrilysin family protein, partial [Fimbriimonas sp.]|nr:pitrilysin family protein [Fimbriimonas sp.]